MEAKMKRQLSADDKYLKHLVRRIITKRYPWVRSLFNTIWDVVKPTSHVLAQSAHSLLPIAANNQEASKAIVDVLKVKVVIEEVHKKILRQQCSTVTTLKPEVNRLCKKYNVAEFENDVFDLLKKIINKKSTKARKVVPSQRAITPNLYNLLKAVKGCRKKNLPCNVGNLKNQYESDEYASEPAIYKLISRSYKGFFQSLYTSDKINLDDSVLGYYKIERLYVGLKKAKYGVP